AVFTLTGAVLVVAAVLFFSGDPLHSFSIRNGFDSYKRFPPPTQTALVLLPAAVALLLVLLRRAARRLVIDYALESGWTVGGRSRTDRGAVSVGSAVEADWIDVLRGTLPELAQIRTEASARRALSRLFFACCGWGLIAGPATGAVVGGVVALPYGPAAVLGAGYGGVVGFALGVPLAVVIGVAITVAAARHHAPLDDPRAFHRVVWS